jgi:Fe-S oxidoreductase
LTETVSAPGESTICVLTSTLSGTEKYEGPRLRGSAPKSARSTSFRRVLTTDPHALNALRNEYQSFGVSFDVIHHTTLLSELLDAGAIEMEPDRAIRATYHDPCYLGRYNGEFEAPRRLIAASGYQLVEMGRSRENSFCCGAGGGRIWAGDEGVLEHPSENRIKEALALGDISVFVVACPKDKIMYSAAVDALGAKDRLRVLDVVELIGSP